MKVVLLQALYRINKLPMVTTQVGRGTGIRIQIQFSQSPEPEFLYLMLLFLPLHCL